MRSVKSDGENWELTMVWLVGLGTMAGRIG